MPVWITPVQLSLTTNGTFVDVDASAYVPADAKLVFLRFYTSSNGGVGVRANGSSDTIYNNNHATDGHSYWRIGLDGNRLFEARCSNSIGGQLWLLGYATSAEANFSVNAQSYQAATTNWEDVNVTPQTGGDTAKMVCGFFGPASGYNAGFRNDGSSDTEYYGIGTYMTSFIAPCSDSGIFEQKVENTAVTLYVNAWLFGPHITSLTNALDKSTGTTGSYQTVESGFYGATGLFFKCAQSGTYAFAIRPYGSSLDQYKRLATSQCGWVGTDSGYDGKAEQKIGSASIDLFIYGYSRPITPPTPTISAVTSVAGSNSALDVSISYYQGVCDALEYRYSPAGQGSWSSHATSTTPISADNFVQQLDNFTDNAEYDVQCRGKIGSVYGSYSASGTARVRHLCAGTSKDEANVGAQRRLAAFRDIATGSWVASGLVEVFLSGADGTWTKYWDTLGAKIYVAHLPDDTSNEPGDLVRED